MNTSTIHVSFKSRLSCFGKLKGNYFFFPEIWKTIQLKIYYHKYTISETINLTSRVTFSRKNYWFYATWFAKKELWWRNQRDEIKLCGYNELKTIRKLVDCFEILRVTWIQTNFCVSFMADKQSLLFATFFWEKGPCQILQRVLPLLFSCLLHVLSVYLFCWKRIKIGILNWTLHTTS